jgi:hypothetical protein
METMIKIVTKTTTERLKTLKTNFGKTYQETYLIRISLHLPHSLLLKESGAGVENIAESQKIFYAGRKKLGIQG